MAWGVLALVVGVLYGWLTPGKQDKGRMLMTGLMYGLVIGLVLAIVGWAFGSNPIFLGNGSGILGTILAVVVIAVLFVIGVWIGDLVEARGSRRST